MNLNRLVLLLCAIGLLLVTQSAAAQGPCVPLSGSISATLQMLPSGPAWAGDAYLSFADQPPLNATIVDQNDGYKAQPARGLAGNEILTFAVENLGSFQMKGRFVAMPGATPYWFNFSETGKVFPEGATGAFAGMTGNLSIHGDVVVGPVPFDPAHPFTWIAQITGSVCGAP